MPIRCALLGNFSVDFSTETHLALSLEDLGHEVVRIQEGETPALEVPDGVRGCDAFFHVETYGLAVTSGSLEERFEASHRIRDMGIPRVFVHLDLFLGLPRATAVEEEPWSKYDYVFTADGAHPDEWKALGVNHFWSPPGVYRGEANPGTSQSKYRSDLAFVGNWRGGYHPESKHRAALVKHLQRRWRRQVSFYPRGQAVRGKELRDLYASVKIVIGDSCLVPTLPRYFSDRVPETIGRGGFLLHPRVEGVTDGMLYTEGKHLACWDAGNWDELDSLITHYLGHPEERERITVQGRIHVRNHHCYDVRLKDILATVLEGAPFNSGQVVHA